MTNPRAPVGRRALMIERIGGALSGLTPMVQACGCEVARAAEPRAAVTLAATMRRLSLVAVNGDTVGGEAKWLIASLKTQNPDLPILWFTNDLRAAASLPNKIDLVTDDLKKLEARIAALLRDESYSPALVRQVSAAVQVVLGGFGIAAQPAESCVKSNLTSLAEITAFLPFSGPGLAGHAILSASASDLASAYRAQFPKVRFPGVDDVEDFLGEMANQLVGEIKRLIRSEGDCRMGLPHFIRGEGVSIRHKAGVPSLAIDFASATVKLHFELCIHRIDGARAAVEAAPSEPMQPGVIKFL